MQFPHLKKDNLGIFETLALSVAIIGPSAAIAIVIVLMVQQTGYSAPLVFLLSMIGIGLVSISIIKMNRYVPSSGSVYNFAKKSLGRRIGFLAGWLIIFAYLMLAISSGAIAASNLQAIFAIFGIRLSWEFIILPIAALVWFLAGRNSKTGIKSGKVPD